ncbi:hypothetical protein SLEP1_g49690 [Rubroshorea leprosula]|uniref:BHLH domain-containing protein n=1 Tax=Rubroshorea leprosula TaxID=152421 RepID=A0AAV5M0W9_9ROSI|nr:hypothetical protein SLEP1_g49690 [Rubroshorea leprosula]
MDDMILRLLNGDVFYNDDPPPPETATAPNQSAFVPYGNIPRNELGSGETGNTSNSGNMNNRMIEFWRRQTDVLLKNRENEKHRSFQHMIGERMRRERHKTSYSALHSTLPLGTKKDKNTILQTATKRIQELRAQRLELEQRNRELEVNLVSVKGKDGGGMRITARIDNPTSGIDSMLEVLGRLKKMNTKIRSIQSNFTDRELVAMMEIESQGGVGADEEIQKAVQRTLQEVETNFQSDSRC